jgi:hypothetical protein
MQYIELLFFMQQSPSTMGTILYYFGTFILLIVVLCAGLEIILRSKGITPLKINKEASVIKPEGKFYKEHKLLGFVHQPGEYSFTINSRFQFSSTHGELGFRVSKKINGKSGDNNGVKPQVWIFGCSYTYGWLVNDYETFPWILQEKLRGYCVVNMGVVGYSTFQSFLLFQEMIAITKTPVIVILAYADFHDRRNTFTRARKRSWARLERVRPFNIPCLRINKYRILTFKYEKLQYNGFPFSKYLAVTRFFENKYNNYFDNRLKSHDVTRLLMLQFHRACSQRDIEFVIAGLHNNEKTKIMLEFCKQNGISSTDISVERGPDHPEHTFYPYDEHPSPLAHKKYAEKLYEYLTISKMVKNNR